MCRLEWKFIVVLLACASFFCVNESATKKPAVPLDRLVYPDELDSHRSGVELQTSYFHHGHPQDEDYDDRAEGKPGNSLASGMMNSKDGNVTRIPIGLIREINDKGYTINDLLVHYVEDYDDFLESRFGEEEKAGVKMASDAKCMPELRTIELIEKKDPSVLYIPSCTRIERCGGCCMHELLACQPIEVETINLQVLKGSYKGGKNFKYQGKEIVTIDKHKKCKCDCKVKEEDCSPRQIYEKDLCKCSCRNRDEEKKCYKENSTKLWNPNLCACQCRQELMCTTGSVFDWKQCKCVVKQVRRRNVEPQRNGYRSGALPVIPLRYEN